MGERHDARIPRRRMALAAGQTRCLAHILTRRYRDRNRRGTRYGI